MNRHHPLSCDTKIRFQFRSVGVDMQGANKERWKVLCEQAAVEQDPVKLHQLIKEINDLLEAKETRLKGAPAPDQSKSSG